MDKVEFAAVVPSVLGIVNKELEVGGDVIWLSGGQVDADYLRRGK